MNNPSEACSDQAQRQYLAPVPTLSEAELVSCGLVKVDAYVRAASTSNALRVRRARQRAASDGLRQLNVVLPVEAHDAVKALARSLQQGASLEDSLRTLTGEGSSPDPQADALQRLAGRVRQLRGWRRWLARLLGLTG